MKPNRILISFSLLILLSCNSKSPELKIQTENPTIKEQKTVTNFFKYSQNETLENWITYYQTNIDSNFKIDRFEQTYKSEFDKLQGNIYGIFDKEFDKTYTDFLIYSPNKQNYIDIDSYQWSLSEEDSDELLFEVDQEINLVNIPTKKVERIGFRGSTGWVEDVYWKNDSIIVLLEITTNRVPIITQMNLYSGESLSFTYQDTLKEMSNYSNKRILKKLK